MGNYCSSGQNKKDDDSLSQKSEEYVLKRISGREPVDIIFFFSFGHLIFVPVLQPISWRVKIKTKITRIQTLLKKHH